MNTLPTPKHIEVYETPIFLVKTLKIYIEYDTIRAQKISKKHIFLLINLQKAYLGDKLLLRTLFYSQQNKGETISTHSTPKLSAPTAEDGQGVHDLVSQCPPLDTNSVYCNLLQCHHFADTSITAKTGNRIVGFISGYRIPNQTNVLFIWQVAVDESARGQGLALTMLQQLLTRESCADITHIHTTITADNQASWALFRKLAKELKANLSETMLFDQEQHFQGKHDSEILVSVGPIPPQSTSSPY